jgi:hypothetical protein
MENRLTPRPGVADTEAIPCFREPVFVRVSLSRGTG